MSLIIWLVVGLAAGLLASAFAHGAYRGYRYRGYGLFGDAVAGMIGAILGSWAVAAFRIQIPIFGLPRTILVAFIGATILLTVLRLTRTRRRYAWSR